MLARSVYLKGLFELDNKLPVSTRHVIFKMVLEDINGLASDPAHQRILQPRVHIVASAHELIIVGLVLPRHGLDQNVQRYEQQLPDPMID